MSPDTALHASPSPDSAPEDPRLRQDLEDAADAILLAPSVHNTQPWRVLLHADRLEVRADRSRQLSVIDPTGREMLQSVGAAVFNGRAALAAAGRAVEVRRFPAEGDPSLVAELRPVPGPADGDLAALAAQVRRRRTNRRQFTADRVPADVLRRLTAAAAAEDTVLVPVLTDEQHRLVARVSELADVEQNADPAYRHELRTWTNRSAGAGDGVPPEAVPRVDGSARDDVPLRDFDTRGAGGLPPATEPEPVQTLVVLASRTDDDQAWERTGEALERVLLELTAAGWAASPLTQAVEVPQARRQLRHGLTWDTHPQVLLRVGRAMAAQASPRRPREDVVQGSQRGPASSDSPGPHGTGHASVHPPSHPPSHPTSHQVQPKPPAAPPHPVPDGRGGTTWR